MDPRQADNMNSSLPPEGYLSLVHYYYAQYVWAYRQLYDQQYYQHYHSDYTLSLPTAEPFPVQNTNYHCEALDFSRSESRETPENQSSMVESNESVNPTQSTLESPITNNEIPNITNENDPVAESQQIAQNSKNTCSDVTESQNDFQVVDLGQKKIKLRIVAGTNEYYAKKREEKLRLKNLESHRQKKMEEQTKTSIPYVEYDNKKEQFICKFNQCGFLGTHLPFVAKHVQIMHGPDTIVCCGKLYPTKGHFEVHQTNHHPKGLFYCQISGCKKSYVKIYFLNKHLDTVHGWKETLLCSACSAILPHPSVNESYVKEHALSHSSKSQK